MRIKYNQRPLNNYIIERFIRIRIRLSVIATSVFNNYILTLFLAHTAYTDTINILAVIVSKHGSMAWEQTTMGSRRLCV